MYDEVKEFFENHSTPVASRAIQQALENILKNEKWLKRDLDSLKAFFA